MRHADELDIERTDIEAPTQWNLVKLRPLPAAELGQLGLQNAHGERSCIDRRFQLRPQLDHRPYVVLVGMRNDDAGQRLFLAGDEADMVRKVRIGQLDGVALSGTGLNRITSEMLSLVLPMFFHNLDELEYVLQNMFEDFTEIFEKENDIDKAILHYNREIETFYSFIRSRTNIPVSNYTLKLSLMKSHYKLFLLYSTKRRDKVGAKKNLDAYLIIEKNEDQRKGAIDEFKKYW